MAAAHPKTTAFYRFSDSDNYYKLREAQDKYLYEAFVELGGKPETVVPNMAGTALLKYGDSGK